MFLIGQYDSPFVRPHRDCAETLRHRLRAPAVVDLRRRPTRSRHIIRCARVPTLVLDDGEALIESTAILDYFDELVGEARAMIATRGARAAQAPEDLRAGDWARRQVGQLGL